ncbi:MAG: hypothetical protein IPK33_22175 [Gemmatimonadetes bacterium]|nr:hypothetical protein [Gemmatimonadota bacterium]
MPPPIDARLVTEVLARHGFMPARGAGTHWLFAVSDGAVGHGVATWQGEWLSLSALATGPRHARNSWALLRAHATLPGSVRYASARAGGRCNSLCTDVWLGSDDFAVAVPHALSSLRQALQGDCPRDGAADDLPSTPGLLAAAFAELPWPHRTVSDGRTRIDFDARGHRFAVVASERGGVVRMHVELATRSFPPSVRRALGTALLLSAHQLRPVRASVSDSSSGERLVFEVSTDLARVPAAIGALQGACEAFGPEARALQDPALAVQYLGSIGNIPRQSGGVLHARPDAIPAPEPTLPGASHVADRIA